MNVRLTHVDGKLPNLALMRLSAHFKAQGAVIHFTHEVERSMLEPAHYDAVFASTIFTSSQHRLMALRRNFPEAIVGGTGSGNTRTVEELIPDIGDGLDYEIYPDYPHSIGFLTRGCRLRCKFCVVPTKEGKPSPNLTVAELWRGEPWPRNLMLLDNDFFALPDWREHIDAIRTGGFKVCLSQGINVRLINDEQASALAGVQYRNAEFTTRRIYTAWDNVGQEKIFMRGVDRLEDAGIPPSHIMAYMLIGYAKDETMERIEYRFGRMVERGIKPYPMVYGERPDLKRFQRWAVTGLYRTVPFNEYNSNRKARHRRSALQRPLLEA